MQTYLYRGALSVLATVILLVANFGCTDKASSVDELRKKGIQAFLNNDNKSAREYLILGLKQAPSDRDLLYFTGMAYKRDFMYDSALVYLRRTALLHQKDREVASALYEVATTLRQWAIAQSALGTLIATGDSEAQHLVELADLSRELDHPLNQFLFLRKYLALHPEDSLRYIQAANTSLIIDSAEVGLALVDSGIARFGESPKWLATRAVLLGGTGRYDEGVRMMRSLLANDTGSVSLKLNLANLLAAQESTKKRQEALALYREIQPALSGTYPIDSIIAVTEESLK
jgi:predicted Zn-dependent protease